MAITLGTNIPSYVSRTNLNSLSDSYSSTLERLSTGQKINSAGDDAAGLVISQNMDAMIRGSKQAMQNIQTAKSFLSVADDGMVSIADHYQRINDLLTNMANDTNDVSSRTAAVREIIERLKEINRLADSTNFNGMTMLDGKTESIVVQMGPTSDANISTLDISTALTDCHLDAFKANLPGNLDPDNSLNTLYIEEGTPLAKKYLIPNPKYDPTVTATNDVKHYPFLYSTVADINDPQLSEAYQGTDEPTKRVIVPNPEYSEENNTVAKYIFEDTRYETTPETYTQEITGLESAYEPNNENCRAYMQTIQDAISQLATNRGLIGAYENRMDSSYDSLSTRITSLEGAKVPYTDTDVAEEATKMIKQQIMQQIDISVISAANSTTQLALSLLGG